MNVAANLLGAEQSPYLLQHAHNPVHWRPWGEAALKEARENGKPILLSIGYAACHWCHVMAHESFEDETTAEVMNRLFVSIKVDREERPDIDHIYMTALHALGEQGGWPLTMFLTPDGTPFWGGTYFPPEPRWGRPSFRQILTAVHDAFRKEDRAVSVNGATLTRALAASLSTAPGSDLNPELPVSVARAYLRLLDPVYGGLRGAPKFPNAPIFRLIWQAGQRSGEAVFAAGVHELLQAMSLGGIYDHLGGGFARYSVDAEWLVPHFEKMLYDNAQLLELLAFAYLDQPEPLYAERAEETVGWLSRDMLTEGAFAASEDADSEGEEGKFYVWTKDEVDARLGDEAAFFSAAYDVTPAGNWEDHTILRRTTPRGTPEEEAWLARCRAILFEARSHRPRPGRDDKVLADWNGLTIAALVRAGWTFGRSDWVELASRVFDRMVTLLGREDGRFDHAWRAGQVTARGLLDDQACMGLAALTLFEANGEEELLLRASAIAEAALTFFGDEDGSLYLTASDAADVPAIRPRTASDAATPNGQGLMVSLFARLWHLTGDDVWRQRAERVIAAYSGAGDKLAGMASLLSGFDTLVNGTSIVVAGDPKMDLYAALTEAALRQPDPAVTVRRAMPGAEVPEMHPAFGKAAIDGRAAAYICRRGVCSSPVTDPVALRPVV